MSETLTQLAKQFVSETEDWFVDTYDSYTEIGMTNRENFGGFISALEARDRDILITESDSSYIVRIFN